MAGRKLGKYKSIGIWILLAVLFLCCLYALHDVQTAQGIGLYFTLKFGLANRLYLDAAVDVVCMAALAGMVYLPCRLCGYRTPAAYLRLLVVYLAMMPQFDLADIFALVRAGQWSLWNGGNAAEAFTVWIYALLPFLQVGLPLFLFLFALATEKGVVSTTRRYRYLFTAVLMLILLFLLFPNLENILLYLAGYLLTIIAFDCWEGLLGAFERLEKWSIPVFGCLLARGCFRLVLLVSRV